MLGTLGRLWGVSGRLVGPKWPPGWLQEAAKWAPDVPRGQEKAAKSWLLDRQNVPRGPSGTSIWAPRSPNWTPRSPNLGPKNLPRSIFWRPEIHISIKCQKNQFFLAKRVPKTLHFGGFLEPFFAGENGFNFDSKF